MTDSTLQMRRLAGKFSVFLAAVYVLILVGAVVAVPLGHRLPSQVWLLLPIPALAFVPSVLDARKLHHTSDAAQTSSLWRRSLALAVVGTVLLIADAAMLGRLSS